MEFLVLDDTVGPVEFVVEEALTGGWLEPLSACDEASQEAASDGEAEADTQACELVTRLLLWSAICRLPWVNVLEVVSEGGASPVGEDGADKCADDPWDAVEVQDAACVMQFDVLLNEGRKVGET